MANIKKLQLNGEDIIPITHESAVIDDNGISIADKYQTKEDQNLDTNSKTIIGAINELNINSVHLGNALGAVEYDDNDNPIIERLDDLESSLIKLIGNSSNNESAKEEALKNLLANILREEGIEITEGNTLTDLITKVDNGFDSKNAEIDSKNAEIEELENLIEELSNDGLDIISATELPATGKENQICVITDNPVNSFIVTPNSNDASSDLDNIICYIGNSSSMDTNLGTLCTIQNNNITIKYYFNEICQGPNRLDSYIYQNSQWSTLTVRSILFIKNNYYVNESVSGTISTGSSVSINNTSGITLKTLYSSSSAGRSFPGTAFSNRINFSSLNKMVIKAYSNRSSVKLHFYACNKNSYMTSTTVSSVTSSLDVKYTSTISYVTTSTTPQEYTIDISSWQGDYYLGICAEATSNIGDTCYVYISHIELS